MRICICSIWSNFLFWDYLTESNRIILSLILLLYDLTNPCKYRKLELLAVERLPNQIDFLIRKEKRPERVTRGLRKVVKLFQVTQYQIFSKENMMTRAMLRNPLDHKAATRNHPRQRHGFQAQFTTGTSRDFQASIYYLKWWDFSGLPLIGHWFYSQLTLLG